MSNFTQGFTKLQATAVGSPSLNVYNEALAVVSGVETTIVSYTVPALKSFALGIAGYDGTNIGDYRVKINGTAIMRNHTNFGGPLYGEINFDQSLYFSAGTVITVTVIHNRPYTGDFYGRIQGVLT